MRRRILWVIPLCLLLRSAGGETPIATVTYKLDAQKEQHSTNRPKTLIYLLPSQALLVLSPQESGRWLFKRLTSWDTGRPKEETLAFNRDSTGSDDSGFEDLKVDPTATYAVIRLTSFRSGSSTGQNASAFIVLVDLRDFTIVSLRNTTDPLFSASEWSFAKNGLLVASAMTGRSTTPLKPKNEWSYETITDAYTAAAITLPELKSSMFCKYELFLDHRNTRTRSDRYLSRADEGCTALVSVAGVPSAENLPDGPPPPMPNANLAGPTCEFAGESPSKDFALYGCRTGHDYLDGMIATTNSRNLTVLSLPASKPVLTIPLPHNLTPYPALLANAASHTWLLLLRDGVKLEGFRLP